MKVGFSLEKKTSKRGPAQCGKNAAALVGLSDFGRPTVLMIS
jgi:hypothetical protein